MTGIAEIFVGQLLAVAVLAQGRRGFDTPSNSRRNP
jgi:hypothetical protein